MSSESAERYGEQLADMIDRLNTHLEDLMEHLNAEEVAGVALAVAEADTLTQDWWRWRGVEIARGRYHHPDDVNTTRFDRMKGAA